MRWSLIAILSALLAASTAFSPAEAAKKSDAKKKKQPTAAYSQGQYTQGQRVASPRQPTRFTVRPRSYLDGGTEVIPGERKFTDYVYPPGYRPLNWYQADPTGGFIRQPLPDPFDLGGYQRY
jgi:hypothetical protein